MNDSSDDSLVECDLDYKFPEAIDEIEARNNVDGVNLKAVQRREVGNDLSLFVDFPTRESNHISAFVGMTGR